MRNVNWTEKTASGNGGSKLPAGGYVLMVTSIKDNEAKEYLELVYDVAEGEHKGHYSTDFGRDNGWAHMFRVSYSERAEGLFKRFLDCIEQSNPSFSTAAWQATSNPQAFVGKVFGAAWGTEYYTNANGEDKERPTFPTYYTADQIRNGEFEIPADKDNRAPQAQTVPAPAPAASVYDEDVPF